MRAIDSFKAFIEAHLQIPKRDLDLIGAHYVKMELAKGEIFQKAGAPVRKIGFVVEGVMRAYLTNDAGEEFIKFFVAENQFVADLNGFNLNTTSYLSFQALTPCTLLVMDINGFRYLASQLPSLELLVTRYCLLVLLDILRTQDFLKLGTSTEKYDYFCNKHSNIADRIPNKYIANYLSIEPQSLSRIKKVRKD